MAPRLLLTPKEAQEGEAYLRLREKWRRGPGATWPPERVRAEPTRWIEEWGLGRPYPKQVEMLEAARDAPQVSVCGANSTGKDWTAARIVLWWMAAHDRAKVVISGPTYRQVVHVVWQEVRSAHLNASRPLGGTLYETPLLKWDEERFVLGFATDRPYNLQGFHSPHLLLLVTEAHGMRQRDFEALERLNPERTLLTGNPLSASGRFYDSHHGKAHLWRTVGISGFDSPNVIEGRVVVPGLMTREDIERNTRNWGEGSPLYRMSVLNEWVEDMGELVVVPLSWARAAEDAELATDGLEVVACDVARYGMDRTVVVSRRGSVARIVWRRQGQDTMATAGVLAEYHAQHPQAQMVVDATGVGAGVVDRLRELGVGVIAFEGGAAASESGRFVNRVAEVWWRMREAYERGLDVEPDPDLRGQVSSRKYSIMSDRRIRLESKDDMRVEGRQSPDEADALAMTFAYDWGVPRLSADSDFRRPEEPEQERPTLDFSHSTGLSGGHASRWAKLRSPSRGRRV